MTKNTKDMTADEKFSASLQLEWDLDSYLGGNLHGQFTSYENFVTCRQTDSREDFKATRSDRLGRTIVRAGMAGLRSTSRGIYGYEELCRLSCR